MKKLRFPLALGLALCSLLAQGQSLPAPKEFYFDADPQTTRAIVVLSGEGQEVVDRLAATVARRPDDVESRVQLARVAMQSGRLELGDELYQAAQRNAASNQRLSRAQSLLETTDLPIERVSEASGLGTATNLRRHFTAHVGVTPTDYRHSVGAGSLTRWSAPSPRQGFGGTGNELSAGQGPLPA